MLMPDHRRAIDRILPLAIRMADRADELTLAGFISPFDVSYKDDGSPVTSIDRRVESDLRMLVSVADPGSGFLGEEFGEDVGVSPDAGRWILDPIDGTVEFVDGDPRFATLIAYETNGDVVVGVVSAPALGIRYWAGRGVGSFVRHEDSISAARVSVVSDPARARALVPAEIVHTIDMATDEATAARALAEVGTHLVPYGPSWQAVRVASGDYDAAIARGRWWDVAPLSVIVREAGGHVDPPRRADDRVTLRVRNRQLAASFAGSRG